MDNHLPYIIWPRHLCGATEWNSGYDPQQGGGEQLSLSGRFHTSSIGRGIWRPTLTTFVHQSLNYSTWRALEAMISGRSLPVLVPFFAEGFKPIVAQIPKSRFTDESTFTDGSVFKEVGNSALVESYAQAGSTEVSIRKIHCGTILSGHSFSIYGRLYTVRFVNEQTDALAKVRIQPELRIDIDENDIIKFDEPEVFCRLVDPQAFAQSITPGFRGEMSIQFIEDTSPSLGI